MVESPVVWSNVMHTSATNNSNSGTRYFSSRLSHRHAEAAHAKRFVLSTSSDAFSFELSSAPIMSVGSVVTAECVRWAHRILRLRLRACICVFMHAFVTSA